MATTNKLTPRLDTVKVPGASWISLDIGLWPGSAGRHLTIMAYFQGRRWNPAAAPLESWEVAITEMRRLWGTHACLQCAGAGCGVCGNVGWSEYLRWHAGGEQRDTENYPIL